MPSPDARRAAPCQESGSQKIATTTPRSSVRRAAVLVDENTITIKGPAIFEALRPAGMRCIFVGTVGGWMLDRGRLADALAALDAAGYVVRVVEAGEVR